MSDSLWVTQAPLREQAESPETFCPVQVFSGQSQMCDVKTELTEEKDACEAQLLNKTTGR